MVFGRCPVLWFAQCTVQSQPMRSTNISTSTALGMTPGPCFFRPCVTPEKAES